MSGRSRSEDERKRARKHGKDKERKERRPSSPVRRSGASGSDGPDVSKLIQDLSGLLVTKTDGISSDIGAMRAEVNTRFEAIESRMDKGEKCVLDMSSKLDAQEQKLAEALSRISVLELSSKQIEDKSKSLEQRVVVAERADPAPRVAPSFDRQADPTVIKVNSKSYVSKDSVLGQIDILADRVGMDRDRYLVKGDPVSKFFTVQFKGTPSIAAAAVSTLLGTLKLGDGEWERVLVQAPGGSRVQIYLGPDKSPKQVKTEILTKKTYSILQAAGVKDLTLNRRRGQVLQDWEPLALVEVTSQDEASLLWNAELRDRLQIDKEKVLEAFSKKSDARPGNFEWVS